MPQKAKKRPIKRANASKNQKGSINNWLNGLKRSPKKRMTTLFLVGFALVGTYLAATSLAATVYHGNAEYWAPRVRACESGGKVYGQANYTLKKAGSNESGAYQYSKSRWNNYRGYAEARFAPANIQDERFAKDWNNIKIGSRPWDTSQRCWKPGGTILNAPTETPPPDEEVPPPVPPSSSTLKPMGAGLYIRDQMSPTQPFIDHAFLNIDWVALEPTRGSFTGTGWSTIDTFLTNNPSVKLRLRIKAGSGSPSYLNAISGQCVNITTPDNESGCIPRFWRDPFMAEYTRLMTEVARRYEANPRVLDVVNGACGTLSAEPFILGGTSAGAALSNAGLDKAGHEKCLVQSTAMLNEKFKTTRISLATHGVWQIAVPGGIARDWPAERTLLQQLRGIYGEKLVLQNNGLANQTCTSVPSPDQAGDLYCYMRAIAIPKGFQQGCGQKVADCNSAQVAEYGLNLGGCFLEHANFREMTNAQSIDARLKANCGQ